jgi:E3 ubiquitin-protein ligase UBR7
VFLCTGIENDKQLALEPTTDPKAESTHENGIVDVHQVRSEVCEVSNEAKEEREVKQEAQSMNGGTSHETVANENATNGYHCELEKEGSAAIIQPGQPLFLTKSWRAQLCRCPNCLKMYTERGVGFLLDSDDTLQVLPPPLCFFQNRRFLLVAICS